MTSIYIGQSPRFINADLVRLDAARVQLEGLIAAIGAIKESAILNPSKGVLDDLVNGLIDCKSNLSHYILDAEDNASMKAAE